MIEISRSSPAALVAIGLAAAAFLLPRTALSQQDARRQASSLDFAPHAAFLDKFKDCSADLWFDRKRGFLMGSGLELAVPRQAVRTVGHDRYVTIAIRAGFHGFSTEWLFVPAFPERPYESRQNSLGLRGNIADVRDALAKTWSARFVKGVPEGPDIHPDAVAYFSDPPKRRPSLTSESDKALRTVIACP
jgi:hypothetical protein